MAKFPKDAAKRRVVKALERLGFRMLREHEHISMVRDNADGTQTPLTMPNHRRIKGSTLRSICTQAGIARSDFLKAYTARGQD
jgi:predicted RNA binding protein YcfA (HicA-like mRNA interferase family)